MQYTDDTIFILNADPITLTSFKIILQLFTKVSGLNINFSKSTIVPFNLTQDQTNLAHSILGCNLTSLPIQYLGLPLDILRPNKQAYMTLVEKMEKKLAGWKSRLISRGGRMVLVNSVLSSIPIYFMSSFLLLKWVVHRIDRIRRQFLWGATQGGGNGMSLLNWEEVCFPKCIGGLGVKNIEIQNVALLLRWWRTGYTNPESLWTSIMTRLYQKRTQTAGPKFWLITGSYFWRQLCKLKGLFHWSAFWTIGNGFKISFWEDSWFGTPLNVPDPPLPRISLAEAAPIMHVIAPDIDLPASVLLTHNLDQLYWRWTTTGSFSAKSFYTCFTQGGKEMWPYMAAWQCSSPATVRIFAYLLLKHKLLTRDILQARGIHCDGECAVCDSGDHETAVHLFFFCPFAQEVWQLLSRHLGLHLNTAVGNSVTDIWDSLWLQVRSQCTMNKKTWLTWIECTCWMIWKQRNGVVFRDERKRPQLLLRQITEEVRLWLAHC